MNTVSVAAEHNILICVHAKDDPTDADWQTYLDAMEANRDARGFWSGPTAAAPTRSSER